MGNPSDLIPISPPSSSEFLILTIAFNEASFIEQQIVLLKKYLQDPFDHIIVDNSSDLAVRKSIRTICLTYGVGYAGVPFSNPYRENKSHAAAMHWAYYHLVRKSKVRVFGFLDHDIFPLSTYSILARINNGIYGRVMHAYSKDSYQEYVSQKIPYWSLWAGFCFFEKNLVKGFFPWSLNFFSKHFPDGFFLDTGGGLWNKLYSKMAYPRPLASYEVKQISDNAEGIQNQSFELLDHLWIHFVSLSNWRAINDIEGKKAKLEEILAKARNHGVTTQPKDWMRFKELRQAYSYTRALPVNYSKSDQVRFESIRECIVSEAFLEELREVSVSQYYIFSGTKLLEDFCLPIQKRGQVQVWKQWLKSRVFPETHIQEAIWITDSWARNYFHWILECLPRLFALQAQGIKAPILIPEHIYGAPYIQESLADLQMEVISFNFRETVKVATLFVASHDAPCAFDPTYLKSVILKFKELDSPQTKKATRKIYVSRKEAGKRKVENESELIPIVQDYGFEILQMEKLSFRDQRDLMRETKILMSIHGAGLANLIFMPQDAKVIELHPNTERYNSCFYHLAAAINLDYYYSFEKADHPNPQEANITVDLEKLENLLKTL